jgi:flavin-dependent dehydrogenase
VEKDPMYDLIVIGGGPAGTAAGITAARHGARVLILEHSRLPRHKVCGEFVSPEALGLLGTLLGGESALLHHAPRIAAARLLLDGRELRAPVAPPAASIARFELDLALWRAAQQAGAEACTQTPVLGLSGDALYRVETAGASFQARSVINAAGRWSNLSPRPAPAANRKWLGIKAHFRESIPPASVDLYFFHGGYCGVQPVGPDLINVSAMVRADTATTLAHVLSLHPELHARSRYWQPATSPVATSPLLFRRPEPLRGNVLLAGDAAGFVDPFAGDGIALALRSGALAASSLLPFWRGKASLAGAASAYEQSYRRLFKPVFRNTARVRRLLSLPLVLRSPMVHLLARTGLPQLVVSSTRGGISGE